MDEKEQALVGITHRRHSKKPASFQVKHAPVKKRKKDKTKITKRTKTASPKIRASTIRASTIDTPKTTPTKTRRKRAPATPPPPKIAATKPDRKKVIDLTKEKRPSCRAIRMVINEFLNMKSMLKMTIVHLRILITMRYPELDENLVHFDKHWRKWVKNELHARLRHFIPPSAEYLYGESE